MYTYVYKYIYIYNMYLSLSIYSSGRLTLLSQRSLKSLNRVGGKFGLAAPLGSALNPNTKTGHHIFTPRRATTGE